MAFQANAFQNNAFQIAAPEGGTAGATVLMPGATQFTRRRLRKLLEELRAEEAAARAREQAAIDAEMAARQAAAAAIVKATSDARSQATAADLSRILAGLEATRQAAAHHAAAAAAHIEQVMAHAQLLERAAANARRLGEHQLNDEEEAIALLMLH